MGAVSGDMQLVRTSEGPGVANLSVGEPHFLAKHLGFAQAVAPEGPFCYPQTRGEPELLRELERRHSGMHVVVACGGKQALSAAFAAYAEVYGKNYVSHAVPYWPSYPFLAAAELPYGLNHNPTTALYQTHPVKVITSPNNPDGTESQESCDIFDAAYASPVYGFTTPPAHWTVAIYSASKMLGLSGLRVGWAVTADARLAAAMATYVERFTSGVAVTSQRHVAHVLAHLRRHDDHAFFDAARKDLLENGETFMRLMGDRCADIQGVPTSGKGMFAWFRIRVEANQESFARALAVAQVRMVSGEACGMTQPGWWRCSMGHHPMTTHEALEKLTRTWTKEAAL
jgi:aspartate/methionine/tyrosine aminotransferase